MDAVKSWMANNLDYTPNAGVTVDEIVRAVYKGELRRQLDHMATCVRSRAQVETIRGNLKLDDSGMGKKHVGNNDDFEREELVKSLPQARRQNADLVHEINRLQSVNYDMNAQRDRLRAKVLNCQQKVGRLTRQKEAYADFCRRVERQTLSLNKWRALTERPANGCSQTEAEHVAEACKAIKPLLLDCLDANSAAAGRTAAAESVLSGFEGPADSLVAGILTQLRSTSGRVGDELDSKLDAKAGKAADHVAEPLKQLWQDHVGSYAKFKAAEGQLEAIEREVERVASESLDIQAADSLKRLVETKRLVKSAEAVRSGLRSQILLLKKDAASCTVARDIASRYEVVERQSKAVMAKKLVIEDLLGQTSCTRDRLDHFFRLIGAKKAEILRAVGQDLAGILAGNAGLAADAIRFCGNNFRPDHVEVSVNRFAASGPNAAKMSRLPFMAGKPYNSANVVELANAMVEMKANVALDRAYAETYASLVGIDSFHSQLESLRSNLLANKDEVLELADKKLKKGKCQPDCQPLIKALNTWTVEPAKDAYMTAINPSANGKTLAEWHDEFRGAKHY